MSESDVSENVFQDLKSQNRAVANAFIKLRHHAARSRSETFKPFVSRLQDAARVYSSPQDFREELSSRPLYDHLQSPLYAYERYVSRRADWGAKPRFIALVLLLVGIGFVAFVVGPSVFHFLVGHWQSVLLPLGGICAGGGAVLLGSHVGSSPLGSITPPRTDTEDPLKELKDLSERTASRLRSAFRLQLWAVLVVGILFVVLILWSVVMVSQNRILYASAFGSGSLAMLILTQWKWQPFDRINQARRQADNADTLATGLRLRMATISAIPNLTERSRAQWEAVEEYLKSS